MALIGRFERFKFCWTVWCCINKYQPCISWRWRDRCWWSCSNQYHIQAEAQRRWYEVCSGRLRSSTGQNGCGCVFPYHRRWPQTARRTPGSRFLVRKDSNPGTAQLVPEAAQDGDAALLMRHPAKSRNERTPENAGKEPIMKQGADPFITAFLSGNCKI